MIRFLQTPGPIKKIVLSTILLVFCGAMVITLIPGGLGSNMNLGGPGTGVVAKVGSEEVTRIDVDRETDLLIRQQFQGRNVGAMATQFRPYFAPRAADQLITQKALLVEADRLGLSAAPEEVRDELEHGPYSATFFPGGKFIGETQYLDLLQQNNFTPEQFERVVKDDILLRKLRTLIAGGATVSDASVHQEFVKRNTKVKFEYAVINQADIRKNIKPTDAELKAFYERNKATYKDSIPEKRKIAYVVLDSSRLLANTQVSHDELQAYYNQHREENRLPEQVTVRHILIKAPAAGADGKVDQKAVDAAKAKAEDILKQLKAGAKFEDLAKKYSEDPGSAKNGGSLGAIGRGRTVPEFEKAAFSLPKGGTSDPVKSSFGFHIIHVDDKQEAHLKTLDEVKAQIEPLIKQEKAAKALEAQASAFVTQARTSGLDKAAAAKGLQMNTSDFFSKTDSLPGIGSAPQFAQAVFAQTPKSAPELAQVPSGFAVYQVLDTKPAATPTFEEARSRVEQEFLNERASMLLGQKTQELSDRAKAEHDLKKAAKEAGATLKTSDLVAPDGQVPDVGSMSGPASVAFSLKPGEISGPINANASGVVLQIVDKQQPTDQDFAQKKDEIRDGLLQQKQGELFGLFVTNLRQKMEKAGKIKINQEEMKGLGKSASNNEEGE